MTRVKASKKNDKTTGGNDDANVVDAVDNYNESEGEVEEMPVDEIIGDAIPKFRALAANEMNVSYLIALLSPWSFCNNCFY